jgi:outer membrane biosynthesis protein TonB
MYYDYYDPSQFWPAIGSYIACIFFFVVIVVGFMIWLYWRILAKAGYNGAWALLMLVPGINAFVSFGILLVLAFGDWPALRRQAYTPPAGAYQPPAQPTMPTPPPVQYQGYAGPVQSAPEPYTAPASPPVAMPAPEPMAPPAPEEPSPAPPAPEPAPETPEAGPGESSGMPSDQG